MSHVMRSQLLRTVLVLVACAIFTLGAFAQSTVDGAIAGTVTDQTKAVVPGAKVAIRNIETNATSTATTDDQGKFRVTKLRPGTYEVKIEAANFALRTERAVVEVGNVTNLESVLGVAGTTENIEITADAPAINTIQQDFATNINQAQINELPINGRRWSNFALLAPGATPDGNFGLISFRGISGLMNNSTVDGGDNNQAFFSEERGRTRASYVVSQASVREFQVNTSNFSAEYGRAAGGVVNSVTKSGTNSLHGSLFYYLRDNRFGSANGYTTVAVRRDDGGYDLKNGKPLDRRHQFGGTIGGPIVKDRLFFFFTYDGQRRTYPGMALPGRPSEFLSALTDAEKTTLTTRGVTATEAQAGMDWLASLTGEVPRNGDQNIFFPKLDLKINDRNNLAVSYNRMRWAAPAGVQSQSVVSRGVASWGDDYVRVDSFNARLTSTITNSIVNEFRYQWGRDFEFQRSQEPAAAEAKLPEGAVATSLLTGYGNRPPSFNISSGGGFTWGRPNFLERFAYPDEKRQQFANTTTFAFGKHLLKVGVDINRVNDFMDSLFQGGGVYAYNNRVDFLTDMFVVRGCASSRECFNSFSQNFGNSQVSFNTYDINWFVQDDFRILPRLTLNLGLRYEYEMLPKAIWPNKDLPRTGDLPSDENNFGPRVGFALDVTGDSKTALRGGYGIYYGRIINSSISSALTGTGAQGAQLQYSSLKPADVPELLFPNVLSAPPARTQGVTYFAPGFQQPQIHQGDLVLEREIAKNTVVSATYLMSLGRHLVNFVDSNLPAADPTAAKYVVTGAPILPTIGRDVNGEYTLPIYKRIGTAATCASGRPNCNYGFIQNIASNVNSNYNALVLQFNRRMTNGLQWQSNYTWSHAIDYGQDSQTFVSTFGNSVFDVNNFGWEKGDSKFDVRHRFVTNVIWEPQFFKNSGAVVKAALDGWQLAPVFTWSTGRPFTESISGFNSLALTGLNGSGGTPRFWAIGRNRWRYPNMFNTDLRLSRNFQVHEGHKLQLMAEAFNIFNRTHVSDINTRMFSASTNSTTGVTTLTYDKTFGTTSAAGNTLYRERQIQFAVRYEF